jgi:hypothetical protein
LSFFDDGEETASHSSLRAPRPPERPRPRRPQPVGEAPDQHTVMMRRRWAFGIGLVLLIVIILIVNGCLKSEKQQALKDYNRNVGQLAQESDQQIARPLFSTLTGASGKSALDVEQQIAQLQLQAKGLATKASGLSVPGEMAGAQRNLLLALDLRSEGLAKIANLIRTALGGQSKQASTQIAGDMEIFLASDVIYSQRVAPLIQQTLATAGIQEQSTASSRFLPNLGWLEPATTLARIAGQASAAQTGPVAPGTHGHALTGVSVGTNKLEPSPTLNHVSSGANPTFTVTIENTGSNPETDVKVDVTVTAAGKQLKTSHIITKTEAGKTVNVDIPVEGVPLGVAAKAEVYVEPVPGETATERNKGTFLAIFK